MPKIALTQSGELASGLTLGWQPVDRAKAYFLHGLSLQDKTIVIWSSAEVPDAGQGVVDYLTGAQIDREERKGKGSSDHAPVIVEFRDA